MAGGKPQPGRVATMSESPVLPTWQEQDTLTSMVLVRQSIARFAWPRECGPCRLSRVLVLISLAGALSLTGCRGAGSGAGKAARSLADEKSAANSNGASKTVLRIVCDIPDYVGTVARMYPGAIYWADGYEAFRFPLSTETVDVHLQGSVPDGELVKIIFMVDREPVCPTIFSRGEWSFRGRLKRRAQSPDANAFVLRLSRFRDARRYGMMKRPANGWHLVRKMH